MIQQIKQLEKRGIVAHQKDVDLTETSGLGLLGEMSVLELQEKLAVVKIKTKNFEDQKRAEIGKIKADREKLLAEKLNLLNKERTIRKSRRLYKTIPERCSSMSVCSERSMMSTMSEDKEMLIESNPNLKCMHNELLKKKAQRMMMMQTEFNQSFKSGSKNQPRIIGTMNERFKEAMDEIDLAEQQYLKSK